MAHEAIPKVLADFGDFCYNPLFSDLTIHIGKEKIFAHKIILTSRSGYFRESLLKNVNLKVKFLENVTNSCFKELLKIIYSGSLDLNLECNDTLGTLISLIDRFQVEFIERELIENVQQFLTIENCCFVLNSVISSKFKKLLKTKVLQFMNENATQILEENHLINLSQLAVETFLAQDELSLEETKILTMIELWRQHNQDPNDVVAKCLRLSRFTGKDLLERVRHCQFIDTKELLEVLEKMENKTLQVQNRN